MSIEETLSGVAAPISVTGVGVVDERGHTSSMSMTMNLGDEPQLVQRLGGTTLRLEMITDRSAVYMKLPPAVLASLPLAGREWIKVDLSKLSGVPGLSSLGTDPTASDPSRILDALSSASGPIVNLGPERVGRVRTTHYRGTLNLTDVVRQTLGGAAQKALASLQQTLPPASIPVNVWVDAHGLVRRVQMTLDLNLPTGQSLHESATVELTHYGPQPPPAIPSSAAVVDLNGLAGASH